MSPACPVFPMIWIIKDSRFVYFNVSSLLTVATHDSYDIMIILFTKSAFVERDLIFIKPCFNICLSVLYLFLFFQTLAPFTHTDLTGKLQVNCRKEIMCEQDLFKNTGKFVPAIYEWEVVTLPVNCWNDAVCKCRMNITGMSTYKFRMRWRKTSILGQYRAVEIQN